jgi:hypothetical protein
MNPNNKYSANGVRITPAIPSKGENVKIIYDGLLSKSGALEIYAHVGFGDQWENKANYKMTKEKERFEVTIPASSAKSLNICFKDNANNWDNNSGNNYSFSII